LLLFSLFKKKKIEKFTATHLKLKLTRRLSSDFFAFGNALKHKKVTNQNIP